MTRRTFDTTLESLWGREHFAEHITVGAQYWGYFSLNSSVVDYTHKYWNLMTITYVRSGVVFFTVDDTDKEFHMEIGSLQSMEMEPYELDPVKDLPWFAELPPDGRGLFRFNDERTKILNFDNSKDVNEELIDPNKKYIQ